MDARTPPPPSDDAPLRAAAAPTATGADAGAARSASAPAWRRNPLLRVLASIRLGVTLMVLVLIYASVFSALPQVRGALEMTEMQAFSHWVFATLIVLFCISLAATTFLRIRWSLVNLGVLTVHTGLLLLALGALGYFGLKIEGDLHLESPRLELLTGDDRVVAQVEPIAGKTWSTDAPMLGGEVALRVVEPERRGAAPLTAAAVEFRIGEEPAKTVTLAAGERAALPRGLSLRLVCATASTNFYDRDRAALYARPVSRAQYQSAPLDGLPIYRERYSAAEATLRDADGRPSQSKRTEPAMNLFGHRIPTGWFEHWRLPLPVALPDAPFDVQVTGYVPYIRGMRPSVVPGGGAFNPAVRFELRDPAGAGRVERTLVAFSPAQSLLATLAPIEFRLLRDDAERERWFKPLAGPRELHVRVREPEAELCVAVENGRQINIAGTPYTLTVRALIDEWPLISPGFENATSPAATIEVSDGVRTFSRTVIQRFPQLSQDVDGDGVRKREGLLDANIEISYRSSANGWLLLAADEAQIRAGRVDAAVFDPDGAVRVHALKAAEPTLLSLRGMELGFAVLAIIPDARTVEEPVLEPLATRRPNISTRGASAMELTFTPRGGGAGSERRWLFFSPYLDARASPLRFRPPGSSEEWEFVYSRVAHGLGFEVVPDRLLVSFFPGRQGVQSWRSEFFVRDDPNAALLPSSVYTNRTSTHGAWTLFQSGAAEDHWSFTVLGVGNRVGILPMLLGCTLVVLGSMYAFYVKPVLLKRAAAARGALAAAS